MTGPTPIPCAGCDTPIDPGTAWINRETGKRYCPRCVEEITAFGARERENAQRAGAVE